MKPSNIDFYTPEAGFDNQKRRGFVVAEILHVHPPLFSPEGRCERAVRSQNRASIWRVVATNAFNTDQTGGYRSDWNFRDLAVRTQDAIGKLKPSHPQYEKEKARLITVRDAAIENIRRDELKPKFE